MYSYTEKVNFRETDTMPSVIYFCTVALIALVAVSCVYLKKRSSAKSETSSFDYQGSRTYLLRPALKEVPALGCAHAKKPALSLHLDTRLPQDLEGFCFTRVLHNAVVVHDPVLHAEADCVNSGMTVNDIEQLAVKNGAGSWRIVIIEALRQLTYERHAAGNWVLVDVGGGVFG